MSENNKDYREIEFDATIENVEMATEFLGNALKEFNCSGKEIRSTQLALEELIVNVANYAYPEKGGRIVLRVSFSGENKVEIEIIDSGVPYNPLEKEDPDVSRPIRQRKAGGLGIYLAKKLVDELEYKYEDGKNHMILRKVFS